MSKTIHSRHRRRQNLIVTLGAFLIFDSDFLELAKCTRPIIRDEVYEIFVVAGNSAASVSEATRTLFAAKLVFVSPTLDGTFLLEIDRVIADPAGKAAKICEMPVGV